MVEQGEWQGFSDRELKNLKQSQPTKKPASHVPNGNGPQRNSCGPSDYGSFSSPVRKGPIRGSGVHTGVAGSPSGTPAEVPAGAFFHKPINKGAPLKIHAYPVSETTSSVAKTKSSVSETKLSVSETDSSVSETMSSVSKTKTSVSEVKSSVTQTLPSHSHTSEPVSDQKSEGNRGKITAADSVKQKDGHGRPSVDRGSGSESDDVVFSERPLAVTLELMQKQQREIETANKKKKALVQQTLMERYKQSQTEAQTLQLVKRELDHVDHLVTRDVSVLREKIEDANREYNLARKRYELAEAEFIAAKVELHKTSELKELLSEHLCTVIQQNEARKARKLAELLQTLNLEPSEDSKVSPAATAVVQKTPTPGLEIWPRDRLRNSTGGSLSSPKGTPIQDASRKLSKSEPLKSDGSTTHSGNTDSTPQDTVDDSPSSLERTEPSVCSPQPPSAVGKDSTTSHRDSPTVASAEESVPSKEPSEINSSPRPLAPDRPLLSTDSAACPGKATPAPDQDL